MSNYRDFKDPLYKEWRKKVYARDKFTCRMCGFKGKSMEAHHIKKWAEFPALRFEVTNGITLCKNCHDLVTGKEEYYESFLYGLLDKKKNSQVDILSVMYGIKKKKNG